MTRVLMCASLDHGVGASTDFKTNLEVMVIEHLFSLCRLFGLVIFVFDPPFVVLIDHLEKHFFVTFLLGHLRCKFKDLISLVY